MTAIFLLGVVYVVVVFIRAWRAINLREEWEELVKSVSQEPDYRLHRYYAAFDPEEAVLSLTKWKRRSFITDPELYSLILERASWQGIKWEKQ